MEVKTEFLSLLKLAVPVIASNLLSVSLTIVDLLFVGQQLSADDLAAAVGWHCARYTRFETHRIAQALGNTWFNFYYFVLTGAATMFDTYCSQAFGAKQYTMVGKCMCSVW